MTDDSGGVYILGDTFLRNFVTTFDFAAGEMRLAINKHAPAGVSVEYKMSGLRLFGYIAAGIIGLCFVVFCIYHFVKRRRTTQVPQKGYAVIGTD